VIKVDELYKKYLDKIGVKKTEFEPYDIDEAGLILLKNKKIRLKFKVFDKNVEWDNIVKNSLSVVLDNLSLNYKAGNIKLIKKDNKFKYFEIYIDFAIKIDKKEVIKAKKINNKEE
jgi:hypothetical protein